ncbi:MAG: AAA family ATPase [Hydrogenobaculum sp.]|nr:MAG: AAA family ATPase [Hydrogenobaculum sp.]
MDIEEVFYRFNPWWENDYKISAIERPKYVDKLIGYLDKKEIELITGIRRVGKSTIFKLTISNLINKLGINPKHIFYISLDFYGIENKTILDILEDYFKIQGIPFEQRVYVFLDEIAYKKNFSQQLKNIYDLYNIKLFATSSSASILKDENAYLTGRSRITEILPLDFEEFLSFKNLKITRANAHLTYTYFEKYMELGGIPQYVITEDIEYIKQLTDDIIYKDIIHFHNIKEVSLLRDFFYLLMERSGKQFSLNKISKVLGISVDTARRFFEYFKDTFLIYTVERCGKLNERIRSSKKIYVADVGIKNAITGFKDKGAIFENLVFLKIKSKNPCYVYEDGVEIDFFTEDKTLIEVKYNAKMTKKQMETFNNYEAKTKIVVDNVEKFLKL